MTSTKGAMIGGALHAIASLLLVLDCDAQRRPGQPFPGQTATTGATRSAQFQPIVQAIPEPFGASLTACALYGGLGPAYFSGTEMLIVPFDGSAASLYDLQQVPGCPVEFSRTGVDAAVNWGDRILLFNGANYSQFDLENGTLTPLEPWPLPNGWQWVDGAAPWGEGSLLFCYGLEAVIYDGTKYSEPFSLGWPGWPQTWNDGVDDVLDTGDGFVYFLRAGEAVVLSLSTNAIVGAPYSIAAISAASGSQRTTPGSNPGTWAPEAVVDPAPVRPREPEPAVVNAYLDNYPDFSDSVGVEWAAMNKNAMPGLDWLGVGLDIVTADPMRWTASPKKQNRAIATSISRSNVVGEPDKFLPYGTIYTTMAQGDGKDDETVITTMEEFHRNLGGTLGGSVGIPTMAAFSSSATMRNATTTKIGSEVALIQRTDERKMFRLELMPTWTAEKDAFHQRAGQKYRQKLTPAFRAAVAKLRVPGGAVPEVALDQMTKNGKLPGEVEAVRMEYNNLLFSYGNYFVEKIEYGGRYTENFELRKTEFMKSGQTFAAYASEASGVIKGIQVGASMAADITIGKAEEETSSRVKRVTQSDGYNGSKDWNSWDQSTQNASMKPVPINISFLPIADLLTKEFFPDDPNIEKKQRILRMATEQHLVNSAFNAAGLGDADEWKSPHAGDAPRYYNVTFNRWTANMEDAGNDCEMYGTVYGGFIYGGAVVPGTELQLWSEEGRDNHHCTVVNKNGGSKALNISKVFCGQGAGFSTGKLAIWGQMIESECTPGATWFKSNWDPATVHEDDKFTNVTVDNATEEGFTLDLKTLKLGAEPTQTKFVFRDGQSTVTWYVTIQRIGKDILPVADQQRCP